MKRSEKIERTPTPYEVARDYLQIGTNILLTKSFIHKLVLNNKSL